MHPLRLIVIGIAITLIGLTVWAFIRLTTEVLLLVGRGVRGLFGGGCCRSRFAPPGPSVKHLSISAAPRGMIRCRNEKCRWENRPHARYCAHCGRPLSTANDALFA